MTYSCPQHGAFASKELLKEHMILEHRVPAEAMNPSPEFQEVLKMAQTKPVVPPPQPQPPPQPPPPTVDLSANPITLTYQYMGACPNCKTTNIRTIMLTISKSTVAVCYCETCKKDIYQMRVKPIRKEEKYGNDGISTGFTVSKKMRSLPPSDKAPIQHSA